MFIYVLRHCVSAIMKWRMENPNAEVVPPHLIPDCNVPLSDFGNLQGDALGLYFGGLPIDEQPTVAFFSPYLRAIQSGEKSLCRLANPIIGTQDDRLGEIKFGIFDGYTKKGRAAKFPEEWAERKLIGKKLYRPTGGENWDDVGARVDSFTADRINTLPASSVVLISCHEVVMNVIRWRWEGEDPAKLSALGAPTASITSYNYDGKTFSLREKYKLPPSPTGVDLFSMEPKGE